MLLFNIYNFENWFYEFRQDNEIIGISFFRASFLGQHFGSLRVDSENFNLNFTFSGRKIKTMQNGSRIEFPNGYIQESDESSKIFFNDKKNQINLDFKPVCSPYIPNGTGIIFKKQKLLSSQLFRWIIPGPIAQVTGRFMDNEINSIGYHEFHETNIAPWDSPFKSIHRGRYYTDSDTLIVFFEIRFNANQKLPPDNFGFLANAKKGLQNSERNIILHEQSTEETNWESGNNIFVFNGKEIKIKYIFDKTVYKDNFNKHICSGNSPVCKIFNKIGKSKIIAKYVTHTKVGDNTIIGIHDLNF